MDVPQLLCSLSLILLIPIGCSQATEDNSPMMQETETEDVLQPPLGMTTHLEILKRA